MKTDELISLLVCAPIVLAVVSYVLHLVVEGAADSLWPRGLRWFPGLWIRFVDRFHLGLLRVFYPEKALRFKSYALLRLESLDNQWRCWAGNSEGGIPEWTPDPCRPDLGRWSPRQGPKCPCGYGDECVIWCGSSHTGGGCPSHNPEPSAVGPVMIPIRPGPAPGVRYDR